MPAASPPEGSPGCPVSPAGGPQDREVQGLSGGNSYSHTEGHRCTGIKGHRCIVAQLNSYTGTTVPRNMGIKVQTQIKSCTGKKGTQVLRYTGIQAKNYTCLWVQSKCIKG